MASIRVRKGKTGTSYAVLYVTRSGQQTSETFKRRKDAEARKSAVEVELRSGTYIAPREARETFGTWFVRWEKSRRVSASRTATDASLSRKHVLPRWESVPLDAITHMDAQAWVGDLSDRLAPASVAAAFKLLKLPLDAAVRDGKIRVSPVLGVQLPRHQRRRTTPDDVLTGVELAALVEQTPGNYKALFFTMGWLGLRLSEALGLRVRDVNFLRGEITIAAQVVEEVAGRTTLRRTGKTDAAARLVPLPQPVADVLAWHIRAHRSDADRDSLLFQTVQGSIPLRGTLTRRVLAPSLARAGLQGRGITLRQLRHTGASLMLDAGVDIQDVSERLGHSRTSITLDVYGHLHRERRAAGTTAMEAAMSAAGARLTFDSQPRGGNLLAVQP